MSTVLSNDELAQYPGELINLPEKQAAVNLQFGTLTECGRTRMKDTSKSTSERTCQWAMCFSIVPKAESRLQ